MLQLNLSPFPQLDTPRLVLRRLVAEDAAALFTLRSDDSVNQYIGRKAPTSIEEVKDFISKIDDFVNRNQSVYWVITLRESRQLIGTITLWNFIPEQYASEIGYELLPAFQGKGFMREALEKVLGFAFDSLLFRKIEGWVHRDNMPSIRLLEKTGFIRDTAAETAAGADALDGMIIYSNTGSRQSVDQ